MFTTPSDKIFRFWFLAFPDIKKPIGGIKQIHRVAEAIEFLGYRSFVVQEDSLFKPSWFTSSVNTISKASFFGSADLSSDRDIIVIPETFIGALKSFFPSIPKIIFNQNVGYTYGMPGTSFPPPKDIHSIYRDLSVKQVWCVSEHDRSFLSQAFNLSINNIHRIFNYVEALPHDATEKQSLISYMPRKNKIHSDVVINLLSSQSFLSGWKIIPISGVSNTDVLRILSKSRFFLPFGHPEGFGLPVAEALSVGCSLVGYHGLGGKELFNIAAQYKCSYSVEYGDYYGFIIGISNLLKSYHLNKSEYDFQSRSMANHILRVYSKDSMRESVSKALLSLTAC